MQQQAKAVLGTTNRQIKSYKREILQGKRRTILDKFRSEVEEFMCCDDNSRVKSGKNVQKLFTRRKNKYGYFQTP
jgi:hypothetical protein